MHCETKTFTVAKFFVEKNAIELDPEYQRQASAWGREKQQLFLDTLFNHYDVPKLYLHHLKPNGGLRHYALVDGKQRLQCIWDFLDGNIALGNDFELRTDDPLHKENAPLPKAGDCFNDLSQYWQEQFKAIQLDVVIIHGAGEDGVEEIFSRLNNGEPLNAAEKRNAMGGKVSALIRELSKHKFFAETMARPNKRYYHYDVAARFLLIEDALREGQSPYRDLKKRFLDTLVRENKEANDALIEDLKKRASKQMDVMVKIFDKKDPLLRSAGYPQLYYLFAKSIEKEYADAHLFSSIKHFVAGFSALRTEARGMDPGKKEGGDHPYLDEFERLMQQGNDQNSLKRRVETMTRFFLMKNSKIKIREKRRYFTEEERYAVYYRDGKKCGDCGRDFKSFAEVEADHVVQWAHGGETSLANARALCKSCNAKFNKKVG